MVVQKQFPLMSLVFFIHRWYDPCLKPITENHSHRLDAFKFFAHNREQSSIDICLQLTIFFPEKGRNQTRSTPSSVSVAVCFLFSYMSTFRNQSSSSIGHVTGKARPLDSLAAFDQAVVLESSTITCTAARAILHLLPPANLSMPGDPHLLF